MRLRHISIIFVCFNFLKYSFASCISQKLRCCPRGHILLWIQRLRGGTAMEVLHHIIVISLQNNIRQASFWSNNSSNDIYNLLKFPLQFSLVVMELNLQPLNPLLHQLLPLFMLSHPIIHSFLHCSFWLPKPLKHVWVILHFSNKAI